MKGYEHRQYAASLLKKYFDGSSRKTERELSVSRDVVELGIKEQESGFRCIENFNLRGRKKENSFGNLSQDIEEVVSLHTQSERCHNDTKGYVKTTAKQVKSDLLSEKSYKTIDFSLNTINNILNRLGYTLKKVRKSLPLKRIEQTDAIFNNVAEHRKKKPVGTLKLSIDVKDKVRVGQLSRKGYHRGKTDVCALDKDQHWD